MKNITVSADDSVTEAARLRARAEHTTLHQALRQWLADYAHAPPRLHRSDEVLDKLRGQLQVGCRLSRDEMDIR